MTLVPKIVELLEENDAEDVLVFVGGTIPKDDISKLKEAGVGEVFTPGTPTKKAVEYLQEALVKS
jgi:methylmalonyl-CoA mutase C-terminal domain/subunit